MISNRRASRVGILGQFDELADGQAGRVVDQTAIEFENLAGATSVTEGVASDGAQRVVGPDLIDRPLGGDGAT